MGNSNRLFRYRFRSQGSSTGLQLWVRADTAANTLILAGVTNTEASSVNDNFRNNVIIANHGSTKSKVSFARTVSIRMTDTGTSGLSIGSRVVIPVFDPAKWTPFEIDQVGTYQGVACICTDKKEGSPNLLGRL